MISADRLKDYGLKTFRFAIVGVTNSALYAIVTVICVSVLGLKPTPSSAVGYVAVLPFAFAAHKLFTFRSHGSASSEAWRFTVTYLVGFGTAVFAMFIVEHFSWHYAIGIVAAVILVPIISFFVLDRWVFASQQST